MNDYEDQNFKRVRVSARGRIGLPAEFRRALGIEPDSAAVVSLEDARLVIETPAAHLAQIQEATAHIDPSRSLVDRLIADRRAEARREAEEVNAGQCLIPAPGRTARGAASDSTCSSI